MDLRGRGGCLRRIALTHADQTSLAGSDAASLDARLLGALTKRGKPVGKADLLRAARVSREERTEALQLLTTLEGAGQIVRVSGDRYTTLARSGLVAGRLTVHPNGFAFCVPDDPHADDLYIPAKAVRPALHGDRVLVKPERSSRRGRAEGSIVRILGHGRTSIVGVFRPLRTGKIVIPQEQRLLGTFGVARRGDGGAHDGDMVIADIVRYPTRTADAEVRVVRVLGPASDPRVETDAVIYAHGLPLDFPPEAIAAARRLPPIVAPQDSSRRLDLREVPLVTIDGENAKDFDDAIFVEPLGTGFCLTVAVSDVSHYVTEGGALDVEARARGTSVYFPDRVVPMLPEELSAGICSLKPGEDRLVKAVRLEYESRGRLLGATFHDAVMRSHARLTYGRVRQALVERNPDVRRELGHLLEPLERAEALSRLLTARRRERGAIDFDLPEAEILFDLRGRPEQIIRAERSIANQIVEEFMLAANEAVARELARRRILFPYRVHDAPAVEAAKSLANFLEGFGIRLGLEHGHVTSKAIQGVLEKAAGRPEERLVHTVVLRSMQQARYAAEPGAHFGLSIEPYTHFTSPIRRYPDLVVQRLLDMALRGGVRVPADLAEIAAHASRRERIAMDAERAIVQLKKIQLMADKVGVEYDGFVSGVAPFGFFVELRDLFVEGLVHVQTLGDDHYEHVETQHSLRGRRTRRTFRIGDPVRVAIAGVSIERRQIDFTLAGESARPPVKPWRRGRRA
jgi:ribonuclease R